jgi:hypothetical protein
MRANRARCAQQLTPGWWVTPGWVRGRAGRLSFGCPTDDYLEGPGALLLRLLRNRNLAPHNAPILVEVSGGPYVSHATVAGLGPGRVAVTPRYVTTFAHLLAGTGSRRGCSRSERIRSPSRPSRSGGNLTASRRIHATSRRVVGHAEAYRHGSSGACFMAGLTGHRRAPTDLSRRPVRAGRYLNDQRFRRPVPPAGRGTTRRPGPRRVKARAGPGRHEGRTRLPGRLLSR